MIRWLLAGSLLANCVSVPAESPKAKDAGKPPVPGAPPALVGTGCDDLPAFVPPACTGTAVLCVDGAATGDELGTSSNPFHSIGAAIAAAPGVATILVAAGDYNENPSVSDKEIEFRGGFTTGGSFQASKPGDNVTSVIGIPKTGPVFTMINASESVIDGFRITGGSGRVGNRAEGGGIYSTGSNMRISCNLIEGNDIRQEDGHSDLGGGIFLDGTSVVYGNEIRENFAGKGAGVWAAGSRVVIERNRIEKNTSVGDHGGGMYLCATDLQVLDNLIIGNEVGRALGYGWGGGLVVPGQSCHATIRGNTATDNFAASKGGGYFIDDGATATLDHELIFGNQCGVDGGAGMYVDALDDTGKTGSVVTIRNTTIADNECEGQGNGVIAEGPGTAVTIIDSIFSGNRDDFSAFAGASIAASYTLSEEAIDGAGNINADPIFSAVGIGEYRLKSTVGRWVPSSRSYVQDKQHSPAIDSGSPASSVSGESSPNGNRVNLGAYGNTSEASLSTSSK